MMFRKAAAAVALAIAASATTIAAPATASASILPTSNVLVEVGQLGATTYTQSLNGVLYTQTQILATEQQIADMSNRIVYVTQISENGAIQVIYMVTAVASLGMQNGMYMYQTVMVPIAALPTGW